MWMGLRFTTEEDRNTIRNVILAATAMAGVQLLIFLVRAISEHNVSMFGAAIWNLLIGLLLPACGYFGAKHSNKHLIGMFCGCSWCSSCCSILLMGLAVAATMSLENHDFSTECNEACVVSVQPMNGTSTGRDELGRTEEDSNQRRKSFGGGGYEAYDDEDNTGANDYYDDDYDDDYKEVTVDCKEMRRSFAEKQHLNTTTAEIKADCMARVGGLKFAVLAACAVVICLSVPQCLLATFAGWNGNDLYKRLAAGETIVQQPGLSHDEVSTEPLRVQPSQPAE